MAIFILNKISLLEPKAQNRVRSAYKRQSIEQFKAFLAQSALLAQTGHAQSRLVDQLERHARLQTGGGVARPTAQEIPGPQP